MTTGEFTIETTNLTKVFGTQTAVDHINVSVRRGEIFGFLGANGAGKTTAIRMLCGLLTPTSGTGHVAGFDIMRQTSRIRSRIGYMSQRFSLYADLSLRHNLELYGGLYGLSGRRLRERMDTLAERVGITTMFDAATGSLPWGWQQRLALACATIHEPHVVFLDEPTGSVDPLSRRAFWDLIHDFAASGTTVFVTTHHMDEAENCGRISIMSSGRIVAVDSPRGLKAQAGCASLEEAFVQLVERDRATATGGRP